MESEQVSRILPQQYPFLFVDRIIELVPGERAVALKNVSLNEPFFVGHFHDNPIVPGPLLVEMVGQTGGVALRTANPNTEGQSRFLGHVRDFVFHRPARPGDTLLIESTVTRPIMGSAIIRGQITVDGQLIAEGELVVAMPQTDSPHSPR